VQRGHEIFEMNVGYLKWFSLGIVVLLIVTAVAAFALLGGFRVPRPETTAAAAAVEPAPAQFATLQSAPQEDLRNYRLAKASALSGYRWVDRGAGVLQIPIERAMELVAKERGGAADAEPAAAAAPRPGGGRQ
jgi:hypothetical protein